MNYQLPADGMIRPVRAEDWEPYRASIARIYADNTLEFTIEQMKAAHGFVATAKQYKKKIKDWGLDNKYIKDYEYEALLLLPEAKEYTVRGKVVPLKDLQRYKRRKEKGHAKHGQGGGGSDDAGEGGSSGAGGGVDATGLYGQQYSQAAEGMAAAATTYATTSTDGDYAHVPTSMAEGDDYMATGHPQIGDGEYYDPNATAWYMQGPLP